MTQDMGFNPLMDFARKTECSVKLPSQGLWYDDDNITFNAIGEVDIRPMLPNDEMMLVNPESLVSGDSIISVIKSCCPSIKRPEELYYPDINVLLLGIRKATYGDKIEQEYICPECWNKKIDIEEKEILNQIKKFKENNNVEDVQKDEYINIRTDALKTAEKIITEMENNNEINVHPQKLEFDISTILNSMTLLPMPTSSYIETNDKLKIFLSPYTCKNKISFTNREIKGKKILKYLEENKNKLDENNEINEEYLNILTEIKDKYLDLTELSLDIIVSCIRYINLPSGENVNNKEYIKEFINNTSSEVTNNIMKKIEELNNYGTQSSIPAVCGCCGHKWEEKFYGFNQADFFGISS